MDAVAVVEECLDRRAGPDIVLQLDAQSRNRRGQAWRAAEAC